MNILYLHGLDSKLSDEKRKILEQFGNIYSPNLDNYEDKNTIQTVLDHCSGIQLDVVMGSSMGGFAGYYVADMLQKPALLFNPALKERPVQQEFPQKSNKYSVLKQIVLGQVDDVINPHDTLKYLMMNPCSVTHLYLHLVPELGHNIPVPFFEEEVKAFFSRPGIKRK